mmetsp:Transcript_14158/g.25660  ORF Transcript_14158/g.25660 Transcript_14158/m.25660 type:complete len:128 (-) Transcript_14158:1164-1547(-)
MVVTQPSLCVPMMLIAKSIATDGIGRGQIVIDDCTIDAWTSSVIRPTSLIQQLPCSRHVGVDCYLQGFPTYDRIVQRKAMVATLSVRVLRVFRNNRLACKWADSPMILHLDASHEAGYSFRDLKRVG